MKYIAMLMFVGTALLAFGDWRIALFVFGACTFLNKVLDR